MTSLSALDLRQWRSSIATVVRRCATDGRWDQLFALGVLDTGLGGLTELAAAVQECGALPGPAPLLSQAFAVRALLSAPASGERDRLLDDATTGRRRFALALAGPDGDWFAPGAGVSPHRVDDGWRLDGEKSYLLDGGSAAVLVVPAGPGLFAVTASADGVSRHDLPALDPTRPLTRVLLRDAPALWLADGVGRLVPELALLVAADSLGGAAAVLHDAVDYARQRIQFGRPIGSFQAVKHRLADMSVALDQAGAAVEAALGRWAVDPTDAALDASIAKLAAVDAYRLVAEGAIQTYGGIGFTWEHPAHIYLKRAHTNGELAGGSRQHLHRVADGVGL